MSNNFILKSDPLDVLEKWIKEPGYARTVEIEYNIRDGYIITATEVSLPPKKSKLEKWHVKSKYLSVAIVGFIECRDS
jgi:hypothetical protein